MEQQQLPPWTKKRRITTLMVMTGFILTASMFIGLGLYTVGVEQGLLRKPISKQTIANELVNDANFVRAVQKSIANKPCSNQHLGFEYAFQAPFSQVIPEGELMCTQLVALHATGADVMVEISVLNTSKEVFISEAVKAFDRVDASLMNGTKHATSRLSGIKNGIPTEEFVIGIDRQKAYLIRYSPTDPTLTGKVISLVESFYSIPQ
jgi:hypothetical protein